MVLLGIDYGEAKLGLALAEGSLAYPLVVLKNKEGVLGKIERLCQENQVEKIILGLPEGRLRKKVEKFALELKALLDLPVEFESECLTTKETIDKMSQARKKRKFRREKEDACAAALILQNYMEVTAQG